MFSLNQLIAGIVLIIVVGIGAFLYRNTMERPFEPDGVACTAEAKLCPDGSAVGRQGPNCEFSACPFPNVELPDAGIAFAVPSGYRATSALPSDGARIAAFAKPSLSGDPQHLILVKRYPVPEDETADDVILARTRYQPADMQAEDFSRFSTTTAAGRVFRATVIERFEAVVHSAYYLPRAGHVLLFEVIEHDVTGWTDPSLVIEDLPEHRAFLSMLGTLQVQDE